MTNKLDLAWDTFYFYTSEISEFESQYFSNTKTIKNFFKKRKLSSERSKKTIA